MCYLDFLFECSTHHLAITRSNWYFGVKRIITFHSLTSLEDFLMRELDTLQYDAITVCFPSRDTTQPNSLISLKPNSIRHLIMLQKYIHHLVQDSHISVSSDATDHALEPDNFLHTTFHQFLSWKLNEITTSSPSPPPSVTACDPRAAPSTPSCSTQLLNFKRGIRGISLHTLPSRMKSTMNPSKDLC